MCSRINAPELILRTVNTLKKMTSISIPWTHGSRFSKCHFLQCRVCHSPLFVDFLFRKCFICSSGLLGCQGYVCFCSSICIKVPSKPIFIFTLMAGVRTIIKGKKCQYLASWATNHKTKDTLLSQTLKVEEKKVSLFFWFEAQEPRYGRFIYWSSGSDVRTIFKGWKC